MPSARSHLLPTVQHDQERIKQERDGRHTISSSEESLLSFFVNCLPATRFLRELSFSERIKSNQYAQRRKTNHRPSPTFAATPDWINYQFSPRRSDTRSFGHVQRGSAPLLPPPPQQTATESGAQTQYRVFMRICSNVTFPRAEAMSVLVQLFLQYANVWQLSELFCPVQSNTNNEFRSDVEADVFGVDMHLGLTWLAEHCANADTSWLSK